MAICAAVLNLFAYGVLGVLLGYAHSVGAESPEPTVLAPGYGALEFPAPTPGSYSLPVLGPAGDGEVIDSGGAHTRLHGLMGDRVVLLSFIYTQCSDANGCPLATAVLHRLRRRMQREPEVANQVRLLSLSFDPRHDSPQVMRRYGEALQGEGIDWRFLTTGSEQLLQPILEAYQQSVQAEYDAAGAWSGAFSHILRVFLIDRDKQLRNIYSVSFLHPDTLISDIKTVLGEAVVTRSAVEAHVPALEANIGAGADLMRTISSPPRGLPAVPVPQHNPITRDKIALGKKLFYDRRLSLNQTLSCAMCHIPEQGFTNNQMATAVGFEGRTVRRNSPTLYNVAYAKTLFHDGRETTLEQQVWGPLLARNEMANPSVGHVIQTLKGLPDYDGLFFAAFGEGAGMETIGMAIASYLRTLNSANSGFDRWYFGGQEEALDSPAKRGFELFTGRAKCAACHRLEADHALFTDHRFHNTGVGYAESMRKDPGRRRLLVAPGVYLEVEPGVIDALSEPRANDLGRYEVTQAPADRWRFKTPSLRNIGLTAPYMHNGAFQTLNDVVEFYNRGGVPHAALDPSITPLQLDRAEVDALVAFLAALTGDNVGALVGDALTAPIGDPGS